MQREEKSERSRRQVLDAALQLFAHRGYRATTVRDIAEAAGVSIGNLYHHFPDKENIFHTLLQEYREVVASPRFPLMRALTNGRFPDNLEQIGFAARDTVRQYSDYMALHYVDVIEFGGSHIRDFYSDIARRLVLVIEEDGRGAEIRSRLRPGVSPVSAFLAASRLFLSYFQLEILFGVKEPFGADSVQTVNEISEILRHGMASHPEPP